MSAALARGSSVFVGSEFVAQYPEGGGVYWVPLQYLLGLRALGVDAWWLELLYGTSDPARDRRQVDAFLSSAEAFGVRDRVVLLHFPETGRDDQPGRCERHGMDADQLAARMRGGLLLNLANSVPPALRKDFARSALLDLDPGPFQIWAREFDLGVGDHDVHCTIGVHLGEPDCPVPLGGVDWQRFWPPVHVPAWATDAPPPAGAPYTTVTQWWTQQYAVLDGVVYDCNKRAGYLECIELPRLTPAPLELAANVHAGELEDRALLARHGWRLADPSRVAGTPADYRRYVQGSRGELACAKPAYVKSRSGWLSDRTVCYLASGRPCVVQATGAEAHLPVTPGLHFFRTAQEAADALREIEGDWESASRTARALAEEVFATRVVLPALLSVAGA